MESCSDKYFQCDLCCEKILEKDRKKHLTIQCKMLQNKTSSDLYECPLCEEHLLEKDKSIHESFACRTLLQINDGPLYSLHEKTSKQDSKEAKKNSTETCINCMKKIPINELPYHEQTCNKSSRKMCTYCNKEFYPDASEALHLKACEVYIQFRQGGGRKNSKTEKSETGSSWFAPISDFRISNRKSNPKTLDQYLNEGNHAYTEHTKNRYSAIGNKNDDLYFAQQHTLDEPKIVCEFCDEQFSASEIVLHMTGCNPGEVSLPKPDSVGRPRENEANTKELKHHYDSSTTSEHFFSTGREVTIPPNDYKNVEKCLEKRSKATPDEFLIKPKVRKCPYCKTILNDNILLFHQKECVHQPIKCPDCSATILLKDSNNHFCKSEEEGIEISEIDLLSEHLKELFTNQNCWDTVLQVESKEFKAHRAILSARSSVFSAMFLHDTSEKQTGIVKIPDCDPGCFKEFLEYLYSGKLKNISSDNATELYTISDKYNVQELKIFCVKYLMQNITLQNFSKVLILADDHDETNFFSAIQDFFNKHFKEIILTNEWENLLKCNFRLANKLLIGKSRME